MGAGPIDPPAARAGPECLMVTPHELGNQAGHLGPATRLKHHVAARTAMRGRERRIQAQCRDYLAKLLHHVIAYDEQMGRQFSTLEEARVPAQEKTALAPRLPDKIIILARKVLGVISQDA